MKSHELIKKILIWAFLFSVFLPYKFDFLSEYFDFYWYYPFYLIALVIGITESGPVKWIRSSYFKFFIVLTALSLTSFIINPYPPYQLVKQLGGFVFTGFAWLVYFRIIVQDKSRLLVLYYHLALLMAAITIPEQLLHLADIHLTPKKGGWLGLYRCYSLSGEPFFLGMVIAPAFIYGAEKNKHTRLEQFKQFIIALGIFFTFSGSVWLALIIYFIIKTYQSERKRIKWIAGAGLILILSAFALYPNTRLRIEDTLTAFAYFPDPLSEKALETNESSRTIYLNTIAAFYNLKQNPVTGGGLGSHVISYEEFVLTPLKDNNILIGHLNKFDGGSGFIRILSETGITGLILFLFLMLRLVKSHSQQTRNAFTIFVIIRLLHAGNYLQYGTFFWFLIEDNKEEETGIETQHNSSL